MKKPKKTESSKPKRPPKKVMTLSRYRILTSVFAIALVGSYLIYNTFAASTLDLTATKQSDSSVLVSWDTIDNADSYRVARDGTDSNGQGIWSLEITPDNTSFNFIFLLLNQQTYTFTVEALNAQGGVITSASVTCCNVANSSADINKDNKVDIVDLSILLSDWNKTATNSDLDNNNKVDIVDLSILLSSWGVVTAPTPPPENDELPPVGPTEISRSKENQLPKGPMTKSRIGELHPNSSYPDWTFREEASDRTQIVDSPDGNGQALRMTHRANGVGQDYAPPGWFIRINGSHQEMYLYYWFWFGDGMQFGENKHPSSGWGGKLPGLGGGNAQDKHAAYCGSADGSGWSNRGMWRQPNNNLSSIGPGNPLEDYVYAYSGNLGQATSCGMSASWDQPINLESGRWYKVQRWVKLNSSGGAKDGELKSWLIVEGQPKLVRHVTGIQWINYSWQNNYWKMLLESYIGGASESWHHNRDENFYYKNFIISPDPIIPGT